MDDKKSGTVDMEHPLVSSAASPLHLALWYISSSKLHIWTGGGENVGEGKIGSVWSEWVRVGQSGAGEAAGASMCMRRLRYMVCAGGGG